jgi:hypothetical protein
MHQRISIARMKREKKKNWSKCTSGSIDTGTGVPGIVVVGRGISISSWKTIGMQDKDTPSPLTFNFRLDVNVFF